MRVGRRARVLVVCLAGLVCAQQKTQPPASEIDKAVEEFKVQTRNLGLRPESPRPAAANGVVSHWHGRVYENFRNDSLDAIPHEIRQRGGSKALLQRNQFGFNVSGPVVIPRLIQGSRSTYFSLSYEGVREHISRTFLRTIPTAQERTGDYSTIVDQAGNILPIYDVRSTRPNPSYDPAQPVSQGNLQYLRDPFPGNRIPDSRLDRVALKALESYPQPNAAVGPFFRNNYFINSPETNTANGMIGKLDHTYRERHRLTTELAFSNGFLGAAKWFPTAANPGPNDRHFESRRGSLEHVFTVSAHTVNTVTFGATSDSSNSGTEEQANYAGEIGLQGVSGQAFPLFQFQPYLSMGRSYPIFRNARNTYAWTDSLSTRRGKHALQVIAQHMRIQVNTFWPQYPAGSFRFSPGLTSLPGIINTGQAFASFLLGLSE
ncbi:MAG: hypothetical protein HY236_03450, partial [Acidobacteria bacterium]|nr:hypothetical protein [Acidobacteriota bacterium]